MRDWTEKRPTEEGWYFWKVTEDATEFCWNTYYVVEYREKKLKILLNGTGEHTPTFGWWKKINTEVEND